MLTGEVSPSICRDIPAIQKENRQSDRLRNVYGLEWGSGEEMVCSKCPNEPFFDILLFTGIVLYPRTFCASIEHSHYARCVNGLMFRIDRRSYYTKQAGQTVPLVLCSLCMSLKCVDYFTVSHCCYL